MSRAFVKEIDDAPPPPPPERPISAAPNRVTPRGAGIIDETVAGLEQQLTESPAAQDAAVLRRDLRYWLARQASMQIVQPIDAPTRVGFGTRVTILRGTQTRKLTIVGEDQADPTAGLVAWTAPLARAIDGAIAGDVVEFEIAARSASISILTVSKVDDKFD